MEDFLNKEICITTDEKIAVMQAFLNGKTIQSCPINAVADEWIDVACPVWNWSKVVYRIKPEPHYVPYCSPGEFFDNARVHNLYLKRRDGDNVWGTATIVENDGVHVSYKSRISDYSYSISHRYVMWKDLLDDYEWADGTRCGIVKD